MKRFSMFLMAALAIAMLWGAVGANAAIVDLTNGDFETNAADSSGPFPAPWYSSSLGWEDYRHAGLSTNTGTAAAFGRDTQSGYFYQSVGTYDGEISVTINGTAYSRTSAANDKPNNNTHQFGDFAVGFFYTPGTTFAPATNTDVEASATLIGTEQEFQEGVNLPGLVSLDETQNSSAFSHTVVFAGSGIKTGDTVWVRFDDGDNIFDTTLDPSSTVGVVFLS